MDSTADAAHARVGDLARCALVGGNGAVGRLFAGALAGARCEITIVDAAPTPHPEVRELGPYVALDVRRPSPALRDAFAGTDCVVLALPEAAALDALPHLLAALPADALLADTLSVKTPFAQAALAASASRELLSLNPMFAPALGFAGHAVLAVELMPGPRSRALLALLSERAAIVTLPDAATHDRMTAALQVAAHAGLLAFGLGLAQLGTDLDALLPAAPPPFLALLALLARIASGSPETYGDIQRANPFAAEARAALAAGLAQLDTAALDADPQRVEALVAEAGALLGPHREGLAAQAAALLARLEPPR
ncbi:MAG TPA: prephenate dehydrogenase/arogenate dehydrogenase family protein [Conexibacter sp.]|nr:prephenate dehydrogenase/arogenate dehydrogenase family protein [Conexibacter sp.]